MKCQLTLAISLFLAVVASLASASAQSNAVVGQSEAKPELALKWL
jgi:hypothetical protein